MNKPHTITIDEIQPIMIRQQIAGSFGKGEHKELIFEYSLVLGVASWTVKSRAGIQIFLHLKDAIRAYNEAW